MATPIEWADEFLVNTGTALAGGDDPHIIGLSNGNILVAWVESGTTGIGTEDGDDIIGKIYDAEGNVVRDSFRLNTASTNDSERDFDIAATNDGGFILVYVENGLASGDGSNLDEINWQRHNANGDSIDSASIESENVAADFLANPQVVVDQSNNTSIVTFTEDIGTDTDIRAVTVTSTGTVSAEFGAAQNGSDFNGDGDVALLTNGNLVSVYEEDDGGTIGIEFTIRTQAGGVITGATNVEAGFDPQVAALSNGNFVMV